MACPVGQSLRHQTDASQTRLWRHHRVEGGRVGSLFVISLELVKEKLDVLSEAAAWLQKGLEKAKWLFW